MTEITTKNFKTEFPRICEALNKSRFVSVDLEFSCLSVNENLNISLFDSNEERYEKICKNCEQLIPIQIGLTFFTFDRDVHSFTADIFTIYLFPKCFNVFDKRFTCQASSLQFLCSNKFDFNKFIYEGVPFLNKDQEDVILKALENESFGSSSCLQQIESLLQENGETLMQWINSVENGEVISLPYIDKYKNDPDLLYLIHKKLRQVFKDTLWTYQEDDQFKAKKVNKEQFQQLSKSNNLKDDLLEEMLGFSRVFKLLVSSKKPLIGHNLLTDLMILVHNFEQPLPKSYNEFKDLVNDLFPSVYDTKCLSFNISKSYIPENKRWKQNSLQHLYLYFKGGEGRHLVNNSPLIEPRYNLDSYDAFHDAGWDSYATGYIFIRMAHVYATHKFSTHSRKFLSNELFSAVSEFKNKVNLIRASLNHIQLDGEDPSSSRPPFLIVEPTKNRKINIDQVRSLLSQYGFVEVKPYFFGKKAIVAVDNFRSANSILKKFKNGIDIKVDTYNIFKHSPIAKAAVWSSIILTGAILAYVAHFKLKNSIKANV